MLHFFSALARAIACFLRRDYHFVRRDYHFVRRDYYFVRREYQIQATGSIITAEGID
jgi:hypothetical protein